MKKILTSALALVLIAALAACSGEKEKLYILNWGEYMDMDVVKQFEEENNVQVVYDEVASNEEMYTRLKNQTTNYDLMFPSEYMVDKMIKEDLLYPIDKEIFTSSDIYFDKVLEILEKVDKGNQYAVPYIWGTLGIMYDLDVEEQVKANGYKVFFEKIDGIEKVGMYDGSRDSVASALLYLGYDVNTQDMDELAEAEEALKNFDYTLFADDSLKTNVASGNLDVALVYSGDYLTQSFINIEDGLEKTFGYYVPNSTNLWVDSVVIPKTSKNQELANKFIQFISDPEVNFQNSSYIGYAPTIESVAKRMQTDEDLKEVTGEESFIPYKEGMKAQVYLYGGEEHYQTLDDIFTRVKG